MYFDEDLGLMIDWECSDCHVENSDSYYHTAEPLCSWCNGQYPWEAVISKSEMIIANSLLRDWKTNHL